MAKRDDVLKLFEKVTAKATELAEVVHELATQVGDDRMVTIHAYECNRRLEDALNRVSNMMPFILRKTDEGLEEVIDSKLSAQEA